MVGSTVAVNFKFIAAYSFAVLSLWVGSINSAGAAADADLLASARQHKAVFDDAEAIDLYTKYLKLHPENEVARRERMEEYRNEHRFDECIADLKILLKSKNNLAVRDAATNLGKLYQNRGNYKDAIATFKFARAQGERTLLAEIVDCAIASGDLKLALDSANQMLPNEPIAGHDRRAKVYMAMHRPKEALADFTFTVNQFKTQYDRLNRDTQEALNIEKKLAVELLERAKCYDALNQSALAKKDRETVRVAQKEVFDETPFLIKDKSRH